MTDSLTEFNNALDRVPEVLLGAEDARVLTDARTSAMVLESVTATPVSVVLVGSTGVGKSYLMNDLLGVDASEVGVLRPTTTTVVMAGSAGPALVDHPGEYIDAPQAPSGMVIVDTPASETDAAAVNAALAGAQVVVLVVSPSRYGDATTRDVWESIQAIPQVLVVLNRQRGTVQERADILSSVKERFSATNIVVVEESGRSEALRRGLETAVAELDSSDGRAVIARRTAAKAGRHVAGAVTAAAMDLGHVKGAVRSVVSPQISGHGLAVHDSWSATERALMDQIGYSIDALDRAVLDLAAVPLAERMLGSLESWQRSSMKAELAIWRDDAVDRFRSDATVRWRRSATHQVLDQFSWEAGVNPSVQVPKRVHRVMGTRLASATHQTHERLVELINNTLVRRLGVWSDEVERIGSFRPGELLAAADRLEASG